MTPLIEGRTVMRWEGDGDQMCRVVALGDSSLTGDTLEEPDQIWLPRALDAINRHTGRPLELVVLARSGARLDDAVRQARTVDAERPDVVVLAIGTNDATHAYLPQALRDYEDRYRQLLWRLRGDGRIVVVTGVGNLAYVPAFRSSPARRLLLRPAAFVASGYVDRAIGRAARALTDVEHLSTRVVDPVMWAGRDWLYAQDRFHPSAAGHDVWAELARPLLADVIARAAARKPQPPRPALPPLRRGLDDLSPAEGLRYVRTRRGTARVRVVGDEDRPTVVVMPDSPNVLEHHQSSFDALTPDFRVVGLEMPGAGYTDLRLRPDEHEGRFDFSLDAGATWILDVLRRLEVERAVVTASCVNGLYAAMAAQKDPARVAALVLVQTPSLRQEKAWARRTINPVLRAPVVGDAVLRLGRRSLAPRWYRRACGPETSPEVRSWFDDIARAGFRAGAAWQLAPLVRAVGAEPDDRIGNLGQPTALVWGHEDATHQAAGTDPHEAPGAPKLYGTACGHFPDLEDPKTFAEAVTWAAEQCGMVRP